MYKFFNRKTILLIFLLIVPFLALYYFFITNKQHMSSKECMSNQDKIVFIIPSTSRNMNYQNIEDSPLINTLYKSLKKHDISNYQFVIGFDDDDDFYLNHVEKLKSNLPDNFHFHFYNNFDKSYVCIVNQLADTAINEYGAEYLYVFADDLKIYQLDYIDKFIQYFKTKNNICLGWGIDEGNHRICTHPLVHKKHVELLGYFYPKEIKNWFCDDWITEVYTKLNKIVKSDDSVFQNTMTAQESKRYEIVNIERNKLDELVGFAVDILRT
jgi:hypothetical protein